MREKSFSNHLLHPACHWQAWGRHPGGGVFRLSRRGVSRSCRQPTAVAFGCTFGGHLFFQVSLTSYTWNDTPSPRSHPKCYEHFGRKSCGNAKHYFRNRILVAAKLLQALCLEAICLPHLFLCVGDTLYHPR